MKIEKIRKIILKYDEYDEISCKNTAKAQFGRNMAWLWALLWGRLNWQRLPSEVQPFADQESSDSHAIVPLRLSVANTTGQIELLRLS
jgi:hypothetical protein